MKRKNRVPIQVERMEEKVLLSNLPLLTHRALSHAFADIDRAAGRFARTHNENRVQHDLTRIAHTIPFGGQNLLPQWQAAAGTYDPNTPGSGLQAVRQIKIDLRDYVVQSVAAGTFRFR